MSNLKFVAKITDLGAAQPVGNVFNDLGACYFARAYRFAPKPGQTGFYLPKTADDGTIFILTCQHPISAWRFWGSNLAQERIDWLKAQGVTAEMGSAPLRFRP